MRVLFVCAENAGRSQIAERVFNRMAEERGFAWRAASAGTMPATTIHASVRHLLAGEGYPVNDAAPKKFTLEAAEEYARIISFGCLVKEAMPANIRDRIIDWEVADPRDADEEQLRDIFTTIRKHVEDLITEIGAAAEK